jgi:hypothetical protein
MAGSLPSPEKATIRPKQPQPYERRQPGYNQVE